MHKNKIDSEPKYIFKPGEYIDGYVNDINRFSNLDELIKSRYQRYLNKVRFQCESYTYKFDKARRLSQIYTNTSIISLNLLLILVMANSFNSLLGGLGELFLIDSIVFNITKLIIVIVFSIASNMNLCTRPGIIKDVLRRKLIQLNSLLEDTSNDLIRLKNDVDKETILEILDRAFERLNDMGYDGIDNDINVEIQYY